MMAMRGDFFTSRVRRPTPAFSGAYTVGLAK
jgi:hypothetical protein